MDDTMNNDLIEEVRRKALDLGAYRAEVVAVEQISLDCSVSCDVRSECVWKLWKKLYMSS